MEPEAEQQDVASQQSNDGATEPTPDIFLIGIGDSARGLRAVQEFLGTLSASAVETTERKRVEQKLHASEERQRLLIDSVQDYAIFTVDTEGRIDSWNAGAERTFGYRERN